MVVINNKTEILIWLLIIKQSQILLLLIIKWTHIFLLLIIKQSVGNRNTSLSQEENKNVRFNYFGNFTMTSPTLAVHVIKFRLSFNFYDCFQEIWKFLLPWCDNETKWICFLQTCIFLEIRYGKFFNFVTNCQYTGKIAYTNYLTIADRIFFN